MKQRNKSNSYYIKIAIGAIILALIISYFAGSFARADSYDTITFSSSGITAGSTGTGYKISGTTLTIKSAGTYKITGSCSAGSIVVDKGLTGVTLIFDNLTLSSSTTAPVVIKKGCSVTISLSGTSSLADKEDASTEDTNDDFEGAAIKVKSGSTLTLSGNGTLKIDSSSCKNGIKGGSEASINITSGTYKVNAANSGIASDGKVNISGGTFEITSGGDAIKSSPDADDTTSAGSVTITGGSFNITAGDDAIHSDYVTTIGTEGSESGPNIIINSCYEGIEGAVVNLHSGYVNLYATDDGINAANGDLGNYEFGINITGGIWYINSDGDGIDSNKDVYISGGKTEVFGSTNGGNAALDYDYTCTLTGGTLLAVGNTGMAQTVSSGLSIAFKNVSISNGTPILIKNSAGETVYSATGVKSANHVVFASADLDPNDTYTLNLNNTDVDETNTSEASKNAQAGGMGGGPGDKGGFPGEPGGRDKGGFVQTGEWKDGWWYNMDGSWTYPYKGEWKSNAYGWWFEDESGWYPTSTWQKIDGEWYYFDSNGYMEANCYRGGYWLGSSGAYDPNYSGSWQQTASGWWYSDSSGWYPYSQWLKIDGAWYYFYNSGYMASNTTINGYRVNASGAWVN